MWSAFDNISWIVTHSISKLNIEDKDRKILHSYRSAETKKILENINIPVEDGDEVVILSTSTLYPLITSTVIKSGNEYTVLDVIKSFIMGLNSIIYPANRLSIGPNQNVETSLTFIHEYFSTGFEKNNFVYCRISNFIDSLDRLNLINLYENRRLKIKDILGDHVFFEGVYRKESTKFLIIKLGI